MDKHIPLSDFQNALGGEASKYKISATHHNEAAEQTKSFVESYAMYDIVAKQRNVCGYAYAFSELVLGLVFSTEIKTILTNTVTFVLVAVSIIWIL